MTIAVTATTARRRAAPAVPTAPTTEELLRCAHTGCCGRTGCYSELPLDSAAFHIPHPRPQRLSLSCTVLPAALDRGFSLSLFKYHSPLHITQESREHRSSLVTLFLLTSSLPPHARSKFSVWQQVLPIVPALATNPPFLCGTRGNV